MRICRIFKKTVVFGMSVFLCLALATSHVYAGDQDVLDSKTIEEVNMIRGEVVTLRVYSLTRVSVADPDIADIADANDTELLLVGQRTGKTALFLWDEYGKRTIMVYVYDQNLDLMLSRAKRFIKDADLYKVKVSANEKEGKIVFSGEVADEKRHFFDEILVMLDEYAIDFVSDEVIEDLVQIDMQITEMSTSETTSLGIDWFTGTQETDDNGITTTSSGKFTPVYGEVLPNLEPGVGDILKVGQFQRATNSAFIAQVNALIIEGKARLLSKPKIVVISGEEAKFLVGGEVPIRTTTISDSGGSQENVEFKEYGISMLLTPTIKKNKIDILMDLEISDIDAATASSISEDLAFSTRAASTHLFLDDKQMIILAGLIKTLENETERRIPYLSRVPIVGALFRSKANPVPQTDLELVIALTPHILRQKGYAANKDVSAGEGKGSTKGRRGTRPPYRGSAPYYMGIPREMTRYVHDVQQKISQAIVYPQEARQYGWEGTVKMGVLILNDGTLAFALIKESSGHDVFDELALNMTKKLAPFAAFPPNTDLQELSVTIPIVYSLNSY
jgi:pilus assembly protein CpaC